MITREQLIAKRDEILAAYLESGMDYDQARFKTMAVGKNVLGLLSEQPQGEESPEIEQLRGMLLAVEKPQAEAIAVRNELPDFSRDTAASGKSE